MTEQIELATRKLKAVFAILSDDVEAACDYGRSDPSPFAHRTLFRTYFAMIEGLSFNLRNVSLACAEQSPGLLRPEEIALLREQKYSLNSKGIARGVADYQRLLPTILFSLRTYAIVHGTQFEPDTSLNGWKAMQEFVGIRNGLEHPKSAEDLQLSESNIRSAFDAAVWWKTTVLNLFETCEKANSYWSETGA